MRFTIETHLSSCTIWLYLEATDQEAASLSGRTTSFHRRCRRPFESSGDKAPVYVEESRTKDST